MLVTVLPFMHSVEYGGDVHFSHDFAPLIAIGMQVLEQRYYWLSPCSMAQAVQQLASALHEDETINPRQVWELLLWWCIGVEYCITLSTHVNTSSAFHCASLCMCVVTAAIWDETKTWCKAGFFRRIRRRFFMQIRLLLIWLGLDVFPNLLVMLCRSWFAWGCMEVGPL